MKKILSLLLVLTLLVTLFVGCGKEDDAATDTTPDATPDAAADGDAVDAVTTASIVDNGDAVVAGLSADGTWIVATLNDISTDKEIVVDGLFYNKDDETSNIYRKLGLYTQDEDHNITAQFSLTAPKMTVKSENFNLQGGTFVGDVYVEANGFQVGKSATVDGTIYFASKEALDTFVLTDSSVVTGALVVDGVDVVSTASLVTSAQDLISALSADGTWIVATYNNMVIKQDLVVDGLFYNKDDETSDIYRKLALYTQDEDRNITASFTLSAPTLTVKSENFKIQGGTFKGDVIVEAPGFTISKGSVDGNVYFASQELMDSMVADETGIVTGVMEVQ
jgi:cytoskeletal protein CcmA (bactofilin family)